MLSKEQVATLALSSQRQDIPQAVLGVLPLSGVEEPQETPILGVNLLQIIQDQEAGEVALNSC